MKTMVPILAAALSLGAAPALALEIEKSVEAAAPPAKVWAAIGDFCGIADWHPAVEACTLGDGGLRTLTLGDGAKLVERLVGRDEAAMRYTYTIVEGPLPVRNYESTISVEADGGGSKIAWRGTFEAEGASDEDAAKVIEGIYDAGLAALAETSAK